jgi:tetratricopeptide (TPR) repeat protein
MHAMQGMEAQRQNLIPQAIAAYQQAIRGGLNHPSLAMALGGLLVLDKKAQEALPHLSNAVLDTSLSAGAMHGLGLAYYAIDDQRQATRSLIHSLREVDTSLTMDQGEVDELAQVYDNITAALNGRTPDALRTINERFISLLSGEDWKQRIADTRRHLDETLRDEGGQGVVDFLVARGSDDLAEIVSSIDRYIRQGYYTLAMEESHRAVEKSPYYLPVHVRMAEVMMKEGRIRQAINKYNTVAKSYLVREERDRAASILGEVLEMAPLDVDIRISLIELLEEEDRWLEALDEYINLAETFQQLGDFEQANDTFEAAEELARRIQAPADKLTRIKHALADIHQMRLNTRQAQKMYEEIVQLNPRDERALRSLIDIYFTQGNSVEAVKKVDMLLGIYARERDVRRIMQLLEELVHSNPSDTGLRKRLASIYVKRGQRREAIEQLDAMGELQLDAGLTREAAKTIRQIIALNPDRVDDYKKLLAQLGG